MIKGKITVLFSVRKITLMYSMYPFWVSKMKSEFTFTNNLGWVKEKDRNKTLLMVGWFREQDRSGEHSSLLEELRRKYQFIIYFDDLAGSESHYLDLLKYFDIYYKKKLFADRNRYLDNFFGNRIYSDYYYETMRIEECPAPLPLPRLQDKRHLEKMKLGWNLALGQYPASPLRTRLSRHLYPWIGADGLRLFQGKFPARKRPNVPTQPKCQARFGFRKYRASVGFQRKLFSEIARCDSVFLTGVVPRREYNHELRTVQATLSPFGWGEVCFRDFEAILNGAVLIKPHMNHLETWPNIYRDGETYLGVRWDGSDLVEKVDGILRDHERMEYIRNTAWGALKEAYNTSDVRVGKMLEEVRSLK